MSVRTYRAKIAGPLISKLKDVIRKIIVNVVEKSKMWGRTPREKSHYAWRGQDLEHENDVLREDVRKFCIVRDRIKLGKGTVEWKIILVNLQI